jgi:hypothetical protein
MSVCSCADSNVMLRMFMPQALTQRKFEWNAEVLACTSQLMRLRHALEFPGGDPNAADDDDHADGCVSADLLVF